MKQHRESVMFVLNIAIFLIKNIMFFDTKSNKIMKLLSNIKLKAAHSSLFGKDQYWNRIKAI